MAIGAALFFCGLVRPLVLGAQPAPPASAPIEGRSLLGVPLERLPLSEESVTELEDKLEAAIAQRDSAPDELTNWVWVGRRQAYLGRFRQAIETYSAALERFGANAELLRHRGHRYLSVRELDKGVADLARAAELVAGKPDVVEPDGMPNPAGVPTSTLGTNIYYHLGLGHYLRGEFEQAARAYERCRELSTHPDMKIATEYWLVLALERAGRRGEAEEIRAAVPKQLELLESGDYHRLLLVQRGDAPANALLAEAKAAGGVSNATVVYGVGMAYWIKGRRAKARRLWRELVDSPGSWASFGYLAAEAELARKVR